MNELDTMKRAKMYLDKLSEGINPLNDMKTAPDDIVNNERISRCFKYVSEVLENIIDNGGSVKKSKIKKIPFAIADEQLQKFKYSDTPISLSEIVSRINSLINCENMKKLKSSDVSCYLVDIDILKVMELTNGTKCKIPTANGYSIEIIVESRTSQNGFHYTVNLYSKTAQQFIIDNIYGAIEINNTKKSSK